MGVVDKKGAVSDSVFPEKRHFGVAIELNIVYHCFDLVAIHWLDADVFKLGGHIKQLVIEGHKCMGL